VDREPGGGCGRSDIGAPRRKPLPGRPGPQAFCYPSPCDPAPDRGPIAAGDPTLSAVDRRIPAGLAALGAVALAALAYGGVLGAPFYLDDHASIVDNPWIRWDRLRLDWLGRTLFDGPTARPVAYLSFALNHWATGREPAGFRVVNVALLVANGLLVMALVRRLAERLHPTASAGQRQAMAALAGLLFVAHPLQTQAVTYLVQRMTGLSVCFYLLALLAWLRARDAGETARRLRNGAACAAAWLLALGSKEIAIALPAAIWLVEWFAYRNLDPGFARRSALWLGLPALGLGFGAYAWLLADSGWGYAGKPFGPWERWLTELRVTWIYLGLALFPAPSRLNLLYDVPLSRSLLAPPTTALAALGLLGLAALGIALARRVPMLSFGLAWTALHLLLESAILPLALLFEHRMLLPSVGLAAAAGCGLVQALRGRLAPALALGLALALALALASRARNAVWADELRLWSDVAAKSPGLVAAQNNLAMALLRAGRPEDALSALERALAIDPGDAEALNNRGVWRLERGELDAASEDFRAVLARAPGHARALYNLGRALALRGDPEAALDRLEAATRADPGAAPLWNGLGAVQVELGRLAAAEASFRRALALDPTNPEVRGNLEVVQDLRAAQGEAGEAPAR
jgi:Flp pilus assembly protein TadD